MSAIQAGELGFHAHTFVHHAADNTLSAI